MPSPTHKTQRQSRSLIHQPHRDAWVEVDLGALEHNAKTMKAYLEAFSAKQGRVAPLELMAVVKADAYGHGASMVAPILKAVASIDEAVQLRQAGVECPILVLSASPLWAMALANQYDVALTVFNESHLKALAEQKKPVTVQVKIDTGMHRIGVPWQKATAFLTALGAIPTAVVTGVFSHFAQGDNPIACQQQWERFEQVLAQHPPRKGFHVHIANSLGALNGLQAWQQCNVARLGITLYGYEAPVGVLPQPLQPVMGLKARFSNLQQVEAGEGVSYNHTYITQNQQWLGTIPLGYADGLPRGLSNQLEAAYQGIRIKQVGMVTMDQTIFDLSPIVARLGKPPALGDVITLLETSKQALTVGEGITPLTLSAWAKTLNTIEYELMCGLRVRLPRIYTRSGV
jgi:alanine racemase